MTAKEQYYETAAKTIIAALAKRNMSGSYAPTREDALRQVTAFLTPDMTVSCGGSMTVSELGIMQEAEKCGCKVLARRNDFAEDERRAFFAEVAACDCYFMSTNAITMDGCLYNIDGTSNRLASLLHGPKKVILLVGMNKAVRDLNEAERRVRNTAAPMNAMRLHRDTPCAKLGFCADCQSADCICCNTVITRRSAVKDRIHVILVGCELGF